MSDAPGVIVREVEIGAVPIAGVSTSTAAFIGTTADETIAANKPTLITSWGEFTSRFGRYDATKAPYLPPAVYGFFANGGSACYVVRVAAAATDADIKGTDGGPGKRTGLQALNDVPDVNIVCVPGITSKTVQQAMISHCENVGGRFAILDSAKDADIDAVQTQQNDVVTEKGHAALYFPWIKVPVETWDDTKKRIGSDVPFMPPSGYVAGIFARSDMERGVHKAPANEIVREVQELQFTLTSAEQGVLNPKGINCIRSFPGRGIRVWGARTTSSDALWHYVNVRRLFLYLEASIYNGTQWVVFEPNDIPLWARVKQSVSQFLTTVWRNGALAGATADEAFFVKCDKTTMTQDDIDNGKLICTIGVAPVKPAEFVTFNIAQWTASAKG